MLGAMSTSNIMKIAKIYRFHFTPFLLFFVLSCFLYPACDKTNEITIDKLLLNCSVEYLNYIDNPLFANSDITFTPNDVLATKIHFEYKEDVLTGIKGGFLFVPGGNHMRLVFDEEFIYDSIVYDGKQIKVFTKPEFAYTAFDNPENPIIYQIDADNKLEKITKRDEVQLNYTYNNNQVIEKSNEGEVIRTFYLEEGNLVKVETNKYEFGELTYKKELLFIDYDDKPNTLKNKFYIPGAFYRAFSKNNYTKYQLNEYRMVDGEFIQTSSYGFSMPIAYTSNGYPKYGDYK